MHVIPGMTPHVVGFMLSRERKLGVGAGLLGKGKERKERKRKVRKKRKEDCDDRSWPPKRGQSGLSEKGGG